MMRALLIAGLLALCLPLAAQQPDDQAHRIVERPEYKGYRIQQPESGTPGGGQDGGSGGSSGQDAGSPPQRGQGYSGPPRRGTGSGGPRQYGRPQRGYGGGGGGLSLAGGLGAFFEALAWIVLIAGVALALFFIVRALLGIKRKPRKKPDKGKSEKEKQADNEAETGDEPEIPEAVFEDALALAMREYKEALANEDYAAATLLAYRIFWLRAGWRGCVEKEDVRTWRDALRMVRARETRSEVRGLLPLVERVRYADYRPNKGEFNTWSVSLERIEPSGVLK